MKMRAPGRPGPVVVLPGKEDCVAGMSQGRETRELGYFPLVLLLLGSGLFLAACRAHDALSPRVSLHYLGHSAFVLTFGDTLRVLTDYGESNAYGLDSPVYGLGPLQPLVVTLSHRHADHAGGPLPEGAKAFVLSGEEILATDSASRAGPTPRFAGDLRITPIPTFEGSLAEGPDNTSFLFEYRGLKILHLGDCQGLMVALASERRDEIIRRIRSLYPDHYDAVLLPIGFIYDILGAAADLATYIDCDVIIPMHFWSPGDRERFLDLMEGREDAQGRPFVPVAVSGSVLKLPDKGGEPGPVRVIGLVPGPWREPGAG